MTGDDFIGRYLALEDRVRRLELAVKNHTESKTFLVSGEVSSTVYVPPFCVGIDPDRFIPEEKHILAFRGVMGIGTATVAWLLNGDPIAGATSHELTTTYGENDITLAEPLELTDGDWLQPVIVSASGDAESLAAAAVMAARAV